MDREEKRILYKRLMNHAYRLYESSFYDRGPGEQNMTDHYRALTIKYSRLYGQQWDGIYRSQPWQNEWNMK